MTPAERLRILERATQLEVRRNELLSDMVETVAAALRQFDVPDTAALLIAHDIADRLADFWGGQTICFPRDYPWRLGLREIELRDKFKGHNLPELVRETGMTERGLRKLLGRIESRVRKQLQANPDQRDIFDG